ncbi:MAG: DUF2071 domain-containing protein [Verrucomicrobia bacterium]|nr:DUF2071 domain-containing protein [Verrucomicrobiota bacterium]
MTTQMDIQDLHERLGKVSNQPISVSSFTNKRLTINYRAPLDKLRHLVPSSLEVEEIRDTGMGMISQCVCDFHVTKFGLLPIPKTHTNEMLCRISVKVPKKGQLYRAYYTLRSDSSSRILGFLGGHFSHFRKAISQFAMKDNGEIYELNCKAKDPLCDGFFRGHIKSLSKLNPESTCFNDIQEATQFVFQLDGSCGYHYSKNKLSFQKIQYPDWDLQFCHEFEYKFSLLDYLFSTYDICPEFDCVLFMEKVPQVWGSTWLYKPDRTAKIQQSETIETHAP